MLYRQRQSRPRTASHLRNHTARCLRQSRVAIPQHLLWTFRRNRRGQSQICRPTLTIARRQHSHKLPSAPSQTTSPSQLASAPGAHLPMVHHQHLYLTLHHRRLWHQQRPPRWRRKRSHRLLPQSESHPILRSSITLQRCTILRAREPEICPLGKVIRFGF